jgi:hypothetical protein
MENRFKKYYEDMHKAGNQIHLKQSTKSPRKGIKRVRDQLTFYKAAWASAESWAGLPKALVYWLALTPLAIVSFNEFMEYFGLGFRIPLESGSVLAVVFVCVLMAFGVWSWSRFGLTRRGSEINALQNTSQYLLYNQHEQLLAELREIKEILKDKK